MKFDRLKSLLDSMAGKYYPGIDICIHHKHKEVFRYQAGYSDMENKIPVDPNSMYYIFSCTKPVTCTAALQLLEKGCYLLNEPVSDYLPEFKDMTVKEYSSDGSFNIVKAKSQITIKQLFSMTSGINYDISMPSIKKVIEKTNGVCPTSEVVKAIAENPLEFHPGTHFLYGLNHDVLGRLIEVWSGMSLGEYLKKNIFEPCGMNKTGFKVTDEIKAKMPPMYRRYPNENNEIRRIPTDCIFALGEDSKFEGGGGGLVSCVDDYIKFADTMSNGGVSVETGEQIISQRAIDLMRTNMLSDEIMNDFIKQHVGYGYGLGVRTLVDHTKAGVMSNIGEFGWDGAAGSYVAIDPEEELAIFSAEFMMAPYNSVVTPRIMNAIYSTL